MNAVEVDSTLQMDNWYFNKILFDLTRKVADNMDLYYITKEFEEFYEMKYNRPPLLVKRVKSVNS